MNEPEPLPVQFIHHGDSPMRLDKFLVECLPELSRTRIQNLIKDGCVTVDGVVPHKSGQTLELEAAVQVLIPAVKPGEIQAEAFPLDVIFENDDLMVVNKPAGMVVHPSAGHAAGTLVHAALAHAPQMQGVGGELRPGVVHRLDKDTSGLILLAKNDRAHRFLQEQFRQRKIEKVYLALVDGKPPSPSGRIEAAVGRDLRSRKKMSIVPPGKGRQAISEYKQIRQFRAHTLVQVHPLTGRTHQIRLHMAFLGCPVTGDAVYGNRHPTIPLGRHFLHAVRLTLRLPGEDGLRSFEAPLPQELAAALEELGAREETANKST